MDEMPPGKPSSYEKEARELFQRFKAKGVILIVIGGNREGTDYYDSSSIFNGEKEDLIKVPALLMSLAQRFADDIKRLFEDKERKN